VSPGNVPALVGLAECLVQSDQGTAARKVLAEALERAPENPEVMLQLGALHGREGDPQKALEWLDRALTIDGRLGNAHLLRAKALVQLGDVPRAVNAFQEACRWLPRSFDAHYNLGVLLLQNGLTEDAVPYLERAIELDPQGPHAEAIRAELERIEGG
jgi:tetratricopeptide (TPR) repeat protein